VEGRPASVIEAGVLLERVRNSSKLSSKGAAAVTLLMTMTNLRAMMMRMRKVSMVRISTIYMATKKIWMSQLNNSNTWATVEGQQASKPVRRR
jgi:hypothetical protein